MVRGRLLGALGAGEALHQCQQAALAGIRIHLLGGALGVGDGEELEDQRQLVAEAGIERGAASAIRWRASRSGSCSLISK